jgi:hypothetical protein
MQSRELVCVMIIALAIGVVSTAGCGAQTAAGGIGADAVGTDAAQRSVYGVPHAGPGAERLEDPGRMARDSDGYG